MIMKNNDKINGKTLTKVKSSLGDLILIFCINNNLNLNTAKQTNSIL